MSRKSSHQYSPFGSIPHGIVDIVTDTNYDGVQAFMVDEDGTVAVRMVDGSTGSYFVKAGVIYPGAIVSFLSDGTTGVTNITGFY